MDQHFGANFIVLSFRNVAQTLEGRLPEVRRRKEDRRNSRSRLFRTVEDFSGTKRHLVVQRPQEVQGQADRRDEAFVQNC